MDATDPQDDREPTISSEWIYRGRVVHLRVDTVRLPNGSTSRREIIEHPGAVGILPIDREGNVVLIRQFRKPIERTILEIPAGTREPDEDVETCLHRELREETGLKAEHTTHLASYYSAVGFCNERMELYAATELSEGQAGPDDDEFVEVVRLPAANAMALVDGGEIVDAKTIIGLLAARARGLI